MQEQSIDLALFRDALFADDAALALWNLDTGEIAFEDTENGIFGRQVRKAISEGTFPAFEFVCDQDRAGVLAAVNDVRAALASGDASSQKRSTSCNFIRSDGSDIWCDMNIIGRTDSAGAPRIVIVLRNDEEDHARVEELESQVGIDAMTGVFNKQHTRELVERYLAGPDAKGMLIIFDLDKFKSVNDTFGHLMGDAVLSDMALSLKTTFRDSDIVGRIGGDEFVAFIPGSLDRPVAEKRAETVRSKLHRTFEYDGGTFTLTCSAGIACAPADGTTYDELFEHADAALYSVKASGRDGQTLFRPGMKMSELTAANIDSDDELEITLNERPVEFIFRTLFQTRDPKMTANLLLELLGKQFNVQRTFVYHRLPDQSWTCFFDWHEPEVAAAYEAHGGIVTDFINMNYRRTPQGLFSELDNAADTSPEISSVLDERGICAFLHAGIMNGDDRFGCVGMDDCVGKRIWTDRERDVLRAFADILGGVLVTEANGPQEAKRTTRLRDVLESLNRPVFIAKPDGGPLLFANAMARRQFDVPDDLSDTAKLPLEHKGFPVIWKDGNDVMCHVLD